jgi:LysR substrate binding domain
VGRDAARDLRRAELLREPLMLAGGDKGSARLADYAERDWIAPPAATSCGELVRRACRSAGFEPRIVAETGNFSVACALAAAKSAWRSCPGLAPAAPRCRPSTRRSSGASSSPPARGRTSTR